MTAQNADSDSGVEGKKPASATGGASNVPVLADADAADWLRVTLSSIGDGVITTDRHGRVTFQNPVAQALTSWTQEQSVGHALEKVFHIVNEDSRAEVENPAIRALRDGVIVGLANHTILISRDGMERPIDDSAAPIRNRQGLTAGAVLVFRDITERRRTERVVRDSELRYRRLFQTAKDGILILDAETGKITDANSFMAALVGIDAHELIGKELHEIGLFANTEESKRAFRELQENKYIRFEHLPVQKLGGGGGVVEVEVVANVYKEDQRTVAQCNVRDISERVAMESKIKQQAEALAEESRRKDEFLAMLSHELRNPLAPIRSAVHVLRTQEREGSENILQRQAHEIIERQVANLTKIISDLMEVSRVVSGRIRLRSQTVDLNEVVRHAVETSAPLFERRGHQMVLNLCTDQIWAHADPTRLEEVFINLLNNAAKYTPDGGRIEIWCEHVRGSNHAQFRVRDNGVGIGEDMLRGGRIFDLFTQADRSLDRADGGLGIGLSLAHRLVELHGGTIEAHSPPRDGAKGEGGSEFIVRLPIASAPLSETPAIQAPEPNSGGLRVLIVDDNLDLVMMLSATLRQKGYSVQTAVTGPDGLAVARQWRPDVLLLDIGLPGLDGYEVARRLRHDPHLGSAGKQMRLIALTGYGRASDVALAREAGFDAHLVKPLDFQDLEKLLSAPRAEIAPLE
ncbi:MAG TPA: PAS domain S-box protein [Phycisphaerales bacterium]